MQALIGQTIDRYQISDLLAEDQLGAIFKAYDPKFDRTVTLYFVNAPGRQTEPPGRIYPAGCPHHPELAACRSGAAL